MHIVKNIDHLRSLKELSLTHVRDCDLPGAYWCRFSTALQKLSLTYCSDDHNVMTACELEMCTSSTLNSYVPKFCNSIASFERLLQNVPKGLRHLSIDHSRKKGDLSVGDLNMENCPPNLSSFTFWTYGKKSVRIERLLHVPATVRSLRIDIVTLNPDDLPQSLTDLVVSCDHIIQRPFPSTLSSLHITSRAMYMEPLPQSLKSLMCTYWSEHTILRTLPSGLQVLELDSFEDQDAREAFVLPTGLQILRIRGVFNHTLQHLPENLRDLSISKNYTHSIPKLPSSLQKLVLNQTSVTLSAALPKQLRVLKINNAKQIDRSRGFPASLVKIMLGVNYDIAPPYLPNLEELYIRNRHCERLDLLPQSLRILHHPVLFPELSFERSDDDLRKLIMKHFRNIPKNIGHEGLLEMSSTIWFEMENRKARQKGKSTSFEECNGKRKQKK